MQKSMFQKEIQKYTFFRRNATKALPKRQKRVPVNNAHKIASHNPLKYGRLWRNQLLLKRKTQKMLLN